MRRFLLLTLFFLFASLQTEALDFSLDFGSWKKDWEIEGRAAAFNPTSHRFRQIYREWSGEYQVEVAKMFNCNWGAFFNATFLSESGRSSLGDKTHLRLYPLSLGVKYQRNIWKCFDIYAGLGITYTILHIHDHNEFVHEHIRDQNVGGIVKTGFYYNVSKCMFLDFFADYRFQDFHFHHSDRVERLHTEVGGFSLGGGIGFRI